MLDKTVVLCMGEFGRTPRINPASGRDHWLTASAWRWPGAASGEAGSLEKPTRRGSRTRSAVSASPMFMPPC